MFTMVDLEGLRTVEEYATFLGEVKARLRELNDEFGVKPLTDEARSEWASCSDLVVELNARITEANARREQIAGLMDDPKAQKSSPFTGRTIVTSPKKVPDDVFAVEQYRNLSNSEQELLQSYRDGAMFAVERAIYPHPESKASTEQEHIQKLLDVADQPSPYNPNRELARRILVTGSPTYLRAFTKYLQGKPLTPGEQQAVAPWTVQTDATGGYMVPFYFDPSLLHVGAWTNINAFRQACTVKTIVGTDTYHGATVAAFTVARAAEAAAATEGLGAVGQISAIVGKVHGVGTLSNELLQDRPDVTSEIASLIAEAKDTEEEYIFTLGVGDALGSGFNPIGVHGIKATSGAYTGVETIGNNVLAAADAYAVEAALPVRHRANAAWFMSRAEIRAFQALETNGGQLFGGQQYASVGYPMFNAGGNTGLRLLQYPIYETPSGASGTVSDTVVAALINPKSYYIIERAGMSVEVIPHMLDATTGYPTGQRGIYAWWRNTAKPSDVNAGRRLTVNAP